MKKKCLANAECPLARAYGAIGDWWSLLIVTRILLGGATRFSQIQECLGMAKNILTARLKQLIENGILERVPASDGSSYHEYVPTARGKDLYRVVVALRQWGERHYYTGEELPNELVDALKNQPIAPVEVRAADGRVLGPDDLRTVTKCSL
ncbi:MAG: helix-turn-helix domain-containing protein [Tepidisphaeraceae bacterium]